MWSGITTKPQVSGRNLLPHERNYAYSSHVEMFPLHELSFKRPQDPLDILHEV